MSQWPTYPLGTAIELAYGKSLPKNTRSEGGRIPVYGSNGIAGWHNEALVDGPTVIVGRKGSAGALQFVEGPCFPIDTTYFVRPRDGFNFDIRFLYYQLRKLDLSRLKTATGVPGLTREDAYREVISVPPFAEQRRIVDLLSRAEGIVRLRREAEKKAAELIPALFLDMFGDPATNPKGWPVVRLDEVADVRDGTHDSPKYYERGIPFITSSNLQGNGIDFANAKLISAEDHAQFSKRSLVEDGDILLGMIGTIGKATIVKKDRDFSIKNVALIKRTGKANPDYLWALLALESTIDGLLKTQARGGNQKFVSLGALRSFEVPTPPKQMQTDFSRRLDEVRSIQAQQSTATAKAQATFSALLAQAFNG